jgi:CTP:molybdopterin cytidylyltransferase MocA
MGPLKQLLLIDGEPLLQRVVGQAARSSLADLIVVLGHGADDVPRAVDLPPNARFVVNTDHARGMGTSLAVGLAAARDDAVAAAVILGDQPGVGVRTIDEIIAAFRRGDAPIVRPVYAGAYDRVPGHPVVIARHVWPLAGTLRGDEGLRHVIAAHPEWLRVVEMQDAPPPDLDTPEDYQRVLQARADDAV